MKKTVESLTNKIEAVQKKANKPIDLTDNKAIKERKQAKAEADKLQTDLQMFTDIIKRKAKKSDRGNDREQ